MDQHQAPAAPLGEHPSPPDDRFARLRAQHLPAVMGLLEQVVAEASGASSSLARMGSYHFGTGGKRLRALLPLAVADALGIEPAPLVPFAAACEMLHNATLVHDDLQDGDRVRRGRATVWAHYGAAQAVNLGDAMFYYALLCLQRLGGPAERREAATRRLVAQTLLVIAGQQQELELNAAATPTLADYVAMVRGKTSGLFALPMAGAAELCGCASALVAGLAEASAELGVLFQMQDDLLDLYGDKGRGLRGSDLREGKRSVLVVLALERASAGDRDELRAILDRGRERTTDEDVERALSILARTGARDQALGLVGESRARAVAHPALAAEPRLRRLVDETARLLLLPIASLWPENALLPSLDG